MSLFATLRVLVTLAATISLLSMDSNGRPIPSSSPYQVKRSSQLTLLSSSPTPPLPAMLMAGDRRKSTGDAHFIKRASFTQQRRDTTPPSQQETHPAAKRTDVHEHIHEHIHGHDHEYRHYDDYYPDHWTKDEMEHHSNHWAWHHGMLHDDSDHEHLHAHIHEHIHAHKRDKDTPNEVNVPRALITERGLLDLLNPLLMPLDKLIPGFVSIRKLLFGDGDKDGGLVETLGGLVLHVETSHATKSQNLYSFSLMTSKNERTQVYLAPVNQSTSDGIPPQTNNSDTIAVKIALPMVNETGSAVLMCAAVARAPPSVMTLESCGKDKKSNDDVSEGTSQFFAYNPSSGSLSPMTMYSASESNDMSAMEASTNSYATDSEDGEDTAASDTSDDGTTKSQLLMHFVPINANTVNRNSTSGNGTVSDESAAPPTVKNVTSTPEQTMTRRTKTPLSIRFYEKRQAYDGEDDSPDAANDGSLDEEPGSSAVGSEAGLISNTNGAVSDDGLLESNSDEPSQIFLAETTVTNNEDDETDDPNLPSHVSQWDAPPYSMPSVAQSPAWQAEKRK